MHSRRRLPAPPAPTLQGGSAEPLAVVADHYPPNLPSWAQNRVQQVPNSRCPTCDGLILRAPRGPAPRQCIPCDANVRRLRQLRAYLATAARLAAALDRPAVAAAASRAIALLDTEASRP